MQTDMEYIAASLNGHPEAYGHLVRRYQAPVIGYLVGRAHDPLEAEEMAQEVFVRSFAALRKLRKREAYAPWLFGIANRVLKETLRAKARNRHVSLPELIPAKTQPPSAATDQLLHEAVAQLHDRYRQIILLRYFGKMSCEQVAQALGIPLGTVTKRLSRAYALLRERTDLREAQP